MQVNRCQQSPKFGSIYSVSGEMRRDLYGVYGAMLHARHDALDATTRFVLERHNLTDTFISKLPRIPEHFKAEEMVDDIYVNPKSPHISMYSNSDEILDEIPVNPELYTYKIFTGNDAQKCKSGALNPDEAEVPKENQFTVSKFLEVFRKLDF